MKVRFVFHFSLVNGMFINTFLPNGPNFILPKTIRKPIDFPMFSGNIKREHWEEIN